eukprot:CAMPEP_0172605202 /NCGR_PEP_ID=MMETSP1068-20121228/25436_1 /TAXON_ID=35684 /ORGANISM="Pseudopedinella elastica, Strain CCMP716" /LENGTH=400 /DNA_ID=CAMNT_0013407531 /DNA_START=105 /DNA_END=1307 /DNA_ORIENTATION=+
MKIDEGTRQSPSGQHALRSTVETSCDPTSSRGELARRTLMDRRAEMLEEMILDDEEGGDQEFPGPFFMRPARYGDLGAATALLVSSFLSSGAAWFTPLCMRELSRLQANFPPGGDPASLATSGSELGRPVLDASLGDGAKAFFGLDGMSDSSQGSGPAAQRAEAPGAEPDRESWPHFMFVAELPDPAAASSSAGSESAGSESATAVGSQAGSTGAAVGAAVSTKGGKDQLAADFARDLATARRVVGFVDVDFRPPSGPPQSDDAPRPYLCDLAVCPAHRRLGIGSALVLKCEEAVREVAFGGPNSPFSASAAAFSEASLRGSDPAGTEPRSSALASQGAFQDGAQGGPHLYLKAERSNVAAMKMYQGLGYKVLRGYDDSDRVLLAKAILPLELGSGDGDR